MKKNIITISESGVVSISGNIQMQDFEIAELFGGDDPDNTFPCTCDSKNRYRNR